MARSTKSCAARSLAKVYVWLSDSQLSFAADSIVPGAGDTAEFLMRNAGWCAEESSQADSESFQSPSPCRYNFGHLNFWRAFDLGNIGVANADL